jgi:iron complex outermembrane receptor protein
MRLLLLLRLTAATIFSRAQQINGLAKDENGIPLNAATVSLVRAKDSSVKIILLIRKIQLV